MGKSPDVLKFNERLSDLEERLAFLEKRKFLSGSYYIENVHKLQSTIAKKSSNRKRDIFFDDFIPFKPKFDIPPTVHLSLSNIDANTPYENLRIDATWDDIKRDGFTLKVRTWDKSIIFGFRVEWIAYTT